MNRAGDRWEGRGAYGTVRDGRGIRGAARPAVESRSSLNLPCATVLVADDDVGMLELLSEVLRARGYQVLTARDGAEAIELTEQDDLQIDCVVTDHVMPGASGGTLAERARLRWTKVPVLIISGYVIDREQISARLGPLVEFLRKPFAPDALVESVDTLLARASNGSH